jgi:protease-4
MPPRRSWLRRLGFLALLGFGLVGVIAVAERFAGDGLASGPSVAVVELSGVISDGDTFCQSLDDLAKDARVGAVVVRIDSPGGAVAPSQEIYDEIERLRSSKPVIASLGNVAASGGYYVAAAANTIVADPGTLTGSIGVIMEFRQLQGLADKLGVSENVIKSGVFKDIGHPLRPMTDPEKKLLQGMVNDVYEQFVSAVARGRKMEPDRVRALADGRVYSGAQAKAAGLVDELGGLNSAIRIAWDRAGGTGEPRVRRVKAAWHPWWLDLLGSVTQPAGAGLGGGLLFLYGGATPQ